MENIEVIDQRDTSKRNTNNNFLYIPYCFYWFNNQLEFVVHRDWYESLLDITKERIDKIINKYNLIMVFRNFTLPNDSYDSLDYEIKKIFYEIYYAYNSQFDYDVYTSMMDKKYFLNKYESIDIDNNDKKYFVSKFGNGKLYLSEFYYCYDCPKQLRNKLSTYFDKIERKNFFIRTLKTSGKNDGLYPINNINSLLYKLCNSVEIHKEFKRRKLTFENNSKILFTEWKDLNDELEFRLIVQDYKLRGISQQKWKKILSWSKNLIIMEKIYNTIKDYFEYLSKNLIYKDCVIDLQLFDNENDYDCKIIEINPGLAAFSSGSNLFNWVTDEYVFKSDEPIMRILK